VEGAVRGVAVAGGEEEEGALSAARRRGQAGFEEVVYTFGSKL